MSPFKQGDVNHDGSVDVLDLLVVAKALGTHPSDPKWNRNANINGDGEIDVLDLLWVAKYLGT
jgi:Ca2+-binding EF-hand superfamily protein